MRSVLNLFPFKVNDAIAAGINALRRLKSKRCGEHASRLSSRLTFAYVYVIVREIHLGRSMPSGTPVSYAACLDEAISAASSQGKANTDSDGGAPCLDELHESDEGGMFPVCITVMLSCVVGIPAGRRSRDIHLAGGTPATGIPEAVF